MVELPTKKSTGFMSCRVEPGFGRAVSALAIESGVLSTTRLTSSMGSGRLSKACACAPSAMATVKIVVSSLFMLYRFFQEKFRLRAQS